MHPSTASLSSKLLSIFFAATLAFGLEPSAAFAAPDSLQPVPGGSEGDVPIASSAEGDEADAFSHYPSEDTPSADGDVAAASSEDGFDNEPVFESVASEESAPVIPAAAERVNEDVPLTQPVAQQESTRSYFLAQTLESMRTVPIVSANLPLDTGAADATGSAEGDGTTEDERGEDSDESDPASDAIAAESTVVGSFEYRGITYAVEPGGETVAVVAVDYSKLPEDFLEAKAIVLPSTVSVDGIDYYSVTRMADHVFASLNSNEAAIDAVTVPLSITEIGDDAFTDFNTLQYILVSDGNQNYSQYDGCLYNADQTRLLLIPAGRLGTVRISPSVTEMAPEAFTHCPSVDTLVADPDSAAYQLLAGMEDVDKQVSGDTDQEIDSFRFAELGVVTSEVDVLTAMQTFVEGYPDSVPVARSNAELMSDQQGIHMLARCHAAFLSGQLFSTYGANDVSMNSFVTRSQYAAISVAPNKSTWTRSYDDLPSWIKTQVSVLGGNIKQATYTLYEASNYGDSDDMKSVINNPANTMGLQITQAYTNRNDHYALGNEQSVIDKEGRVDMSSACCYRDGHEHAFACTPVKDTGATNKYLVYSKDLGFIMSREGTQRVPLLSPDGVKTTSTGDRLTGLAVKCDYALRITFPNAAPGTLISCTHQRGYSTNGAAFLIAPYRIKWDLNGGKVNGSANYGDWEIYVTHDGTKLSENRTSKAIPSPVKDGSVFAGWYTPSGALVDLNTVITGNTTLSAKWNNDSCTISFDANGGTGGSSGIQKYGNNLTLPTNPTWTGREFAGWYTAKTGGTQVTSSTKVTGDATYYAHWNAKTYTLTVNPDGGTISGCEAGKSTTFTMTYGTADYYHIGNTFTKTGYAFAGLYAGTTQVYDKNGTCIKNTAYFNDKNFWIYDKDLTVTAHWTPHSYTVEYWNKTNTQKIGSDDQFKYGTGHNLWSLIEKVSSYVNAGYTAKGWSTSANQTVATYGFSTSQSALTSENNGTVKLYLAEEPKTITTTWDINGGWIDGGKGPFARQTTYGSTIKLGDASVWESPRFWSEDGSISPKPGHSFAGWFTAATGGTQVYPTTALPTENANYYAHWDVKQYDVTFKVRGKDGTWTEEKSKYGYGGDIIFKQYIDADKGWTFYGWYYDEGFTSFVEGSPDTTTGQNLTFFARWGANTYGLTFNANGGEGGVTGPIKATYASDMPDLPEGWKPARKGYEFTGWYYAHTATLGGNLGTQYYTADGESAREYDVAGNIELKAGWSRWPFHAVTLNDSLDVGNGSIWYWPERGYTSTNVNGLPKDGSRDDEIELVSKDDEDPRIVTPPSVEDYEFLGYFDNKQGEEGAVRKIDELGNLLTDEPITEATTWYAHWQRLGCAVDLKATYGTTPFDLVDDDWTKSIEHVAFGQPFATPLDEDGDGGYGERIESVAVPKRAGYTFLGYYDEPNPEAVAGDDLAGTQWIDSGGTLLGTWIEPEGLEDKAPATLYAAWRKDVYRLSFDPNYDDDVSSGEDVACIYIDHDGGIFGGTATAGAVSDGRLAAAPVAPAPKAQRMEGTDTWRSLVFTAWRACEGSDDDVSLGSLQALSTDDIHALLDDASLARPIEDDEMTEADEAVHASYALAFEAVWDPAVSAVCPLCVTLALDTETGDVAIPSRGFGIESSNGESLQVAALYYERMDEAGTLGSKRSPFVKESETEVPVRLNVFAGEQTQDLDMGRASIEAATVKGSYGRSEERSPLSIDLSATSALFVPHDNALFASFTRLPIRYGLDLDGVSTATLSRIRDLMPSMDGELRESGWTEDAVPIARLLYTVQLAK